jgi:uncharacterized LabA/DUF88 family protein
MSKKLVAVLIDGGFLIPKLSRKIKTRKITAQDILKFANDCVNGDEELFRIYYYDCPPFDQKVTNPLSNSVIDFKTTFVYKEKMDLQKELAAQNYIMLRQGELKRDGWKIKHQSQKLLMDGSKTEINASDLDYDFRQKRVDILLGLDIASLASKKIVQRLVIITGDEDFIPAIEFARDEGIQVIIIKMDNQLTSGMIKSSDEIREAPYPSGV